METKLLTTPLFTPSSHFPTFKINQESNPSSLKPKSISSSHRQLNSTLLRKPDSKPSIISTPEEPETFPIDAVDNNTILDVLRLFDGLNLVVTPDVYASLVVECTRKGDDVQALGLYGHMKGNRKMVKYLKGSTGLLLFNRILLMLVSCGCLDVAHQVFDEMPFKNSISLAVLIAAFVDDELFEESLSLFVCMYECFMRHDSYKALEAVLVCVLKACVGLNDVNLGKMVHGWLVKMGYGGEVFVGVAFIEFYGKCRCLLEANHMFYQQVQLDGHCDTSLWTCAIVNNFRLGDFDEVIRIVQKMGQAGVTMNKRMISSVLKACGRVNDGSLGRQVHANAIKSDLDSLVFVMSGLVDMYARCGLLNDARKVFDMIDRKNRSSLCWNAMVSGLVEHGMWIEAIKMLYEMKSAGIQPKEAIIGKVRMACGDISPCE